MRCCVLLRVPCGWSICLTTRREHDPSLTSILVMVPCSLACCAVVGLKGFIDATVEVCVTSTRGHGSSFSRKTLPLELKTGRQGGNGGVSHHAQLQLYALMLANRYPHPLAENDEDKTNSPPDAVAATAAGFAPRAPRPSQEAGLLLYVSTRAATATASPAGRTRRQEAETCIECVPMSGGDLRQLIFHRNRMAEYLTNLQATTPPASRDTSPQQLQVPLERSLSGALSKANVAEAETVKLPPMQGQTEMECSRCYQREVQTNCATVCDWFIARWCG